MKKQSLKKIEVNVKKTNIHSLRNIVKLLQKNKIPLLNLYFDNKNPPDFFKLKTLLYYLINKYEDKTSIIFFNLPYCIMPDAEEHIVNPESENKTKVQECKKCRFNGFCGGFPEKYENIKAQTIVDKPKEISIELTTKCNLDCDFCFNKTTYNDDYSLDEEKVFSILEQTAKLGVKRIRFTGGEPLLDEKLSEYAEYAKKLDLEVWLNTNGFAVDRYTNDLLRLFDSVLIPFHGVRESRITGKPKSTQRKIETIKKIKKAKRNIFLRIGTVILDKNLNEIEKIYNIVKLLKIKWELYRLIGNKNTINRPKDFQRLYDILFKIYLRDSKMFSVTNAFPFCLFNDMNKARLFSIGGFLDDGRDRIVINARGEAKPTYYSKDVLGSWKDIKSVWENETMRKLRNLTYLPKKCKYCTYKSICRGGSRTLAKNEYGSYYGKDPVLEAF